jgi:HK97 family phage major capsid protein
MRIKLVKEYEGQPIDSVIEIADEQGNALIKEGHILFTDAVEKDEQEVEVKNLKEEIKMTIEQKEVVKEVAPQIIVKQEAPLIKFSNAIKQMKSGKLQGITLKAASGQNEGTAADGGYLVIQGLDELQGALELGSVIYPKCRKMNNFGPNEYGKFIPYRDESTLNTTSAPRVYEPGEGNAKTATKMAFNKHDLKLATDAVVVYLTDEILSDVDYLQEYIISNAGGKLMWTRDYNILKGTYSAGVQGCIGVFDGGAANFYTEPVAHAATYTGLIINKIISGLTPELRNGAEWFMSNSVHATLVGQLGSGTTTSTQPLFSNNNMTLAGYPVNIISQLSAFGSAGDILFGNFAKGYTVCQKGEIEITISKDLAFLTDETVLRFTLRYLGAPTFRKFAAVDSVTTCAFSSTSGT